MISSELSRRGRLLVLAICCASVVVVVMDISIVNVALPAIRHDLHASVSRLQWTVDAYTLVLSGFLVMAGSTADRIGRRRVFQAGLATFGIGSLLCGLAPGIEWLIAARVLQAVGGTMLNPVAMAIVVAAFPDRAERARAIGVFGSMSGLALALGPILGGALVDGFGWRSVFWVNVPVVAAAVVGVALYVPESRAARARRFDPIGQVLVVATLGSVVYAIIEAREAGWTSPLILGLLAVAAAGLAAIIGYESRREDPLLELRLFRSVPFSAAILMALWALCGFGAFLFVTTQYLQDVRGMPALAAGLCMLPVGLLVVVLSPRVGRLIATRGPRLPLVVAGTALALGGGASLLLVPSSPIPVVLGAYLLFGVFLGTVNPPITNTAVSGMPASMAGVAASLASSGRQAGTTLGVAISGTIVGSTTGREFTDAAHGVWWMVAGLGAGVVGLGLLSTGRWALATAERAAALFEDVDRGTRVPDAPLLRR
ncbi:DHA2 family efflux MFS transporter permease subunit [Actinomadura logoneensis]|uniref:DHA2 family efflux MFS transporter permease subunit n=1 Tax=Actinomadura logoneensis TaxID=2293572 RepID=A0A372JIV9_9ACTN|nr:MFS transporter [Actinomadura logoneensis]RFU39947.1 DHA2 family efflux MFS transporter permease subunit [Actinomadura logoneensis]